MNELKVNFDNLTEEERAELLKLVEKANKPKNKVWKPENKERYYYIYSGGKVGSTFWANFCDDKEYYSLGNVFKTAEEAQNAVERLKIRAELQRFADEHNDPIDWWNHDTDKWYIKFDYWCKTVGCSRVSWLRDTFQIYFSSEKIAKAVVQAVGEERIKKYLFEVEE